MEIIPSTFPTVYSPVTRAHIHIHSPLYSHSRESPFRCIHLNVLKSSVLSVWLCSAHWYSFLWSHERRRIKYDAAEESWKTKRCVEVRERRWRRGKGKWGEMKWGEVRLSHFCLSLIEQYQKESSKHFCHPFLALFSLQPVSIMCWDKTCSERRLFGTVNGALARN